MFKGVTYVKTLKGILSDSYEFKDGDKLYYIDRKTLEVTKEKKLYDICVRGKISCALIDKKGEVISYSIHDLDRFNRYNFRFASRIGFLEG